MSSEISEESIRKLLEKTIKPKLSNRYYDILLMFLNWLASLGLRPSTRYRYAEVVASFLKWLQEREIDPYNFKLLDIEEYFTEIRKKGLSTGALHWYVIGVKKLLKYYIYLTDEEKYRRLYNKIKVPRKTTSLPEILTSEEILRILNALDNAKHRALYALIYETGCRISEALNLKIKDVSIDDYGIKIYFRKSKSEARAVRVAIFSKILLNWLNLHRKRDDPEAYLFYGRNPYQRMARSNATLILKRAAKKAGIKKRVHPHILRHTRATELYRFFKELEMMRWFGWRTRKMIDVYSKITQEDVDEKYIKKVVRVEAPINKENLIQVIKCSKCGTINPPGAKYCYNCGNKLI